MKDPAAGWPFPGAATAAGLAGVALVTLAIYAQTLPVKPLDYEDSFYLIRNPYVNVPHPWSRLAAVWTEPYFANFHPVTTTTWLLDQWLAGGARPLNSIPFRITHLVYAALGAFLLVPLFRRLGIPAILAAAGAILFAAHPIHTEVVAWLSARKDLTALILSVAAMIAYADARQSRTAAEWRRRQLWTCLATLLAVLAKPTAVVLPVLFIAFELCAGGHPESTAPTAVLNRRVVGLLALLAGAGGVLFALFREFLRHDPAHGAWLAAVPVALAALLWLRPVREQDLAALRAGTSPALGLLAPAHVAFAGVAAASSAWTFWAQSAVGAIKGGLTLLPTVNLTLDAMLAYTGKVFVPAFMSTSYIWSAYPTVSARGVAGALLVAALAGAALYLARARTPLLRAAAFGILWYLVAFIPVSNLVPTSTKMADRYLFLPSIGAILAVVALAAHFAARARTRQIAVLSCLTVVAGAYAVWGHARAEVWCGKTTPWKGSPHPDLSLWSRAADTHPDNHSALTSLAMVYLGMEPPESERALAHLTRALELADAQQSRIAGGKRLDISPLYQALGNAHLELARGKWKGDAAARADALGRAVGYFEEAARTPLGFAPADARLLWRLAEAREEQASIEDRRLAQVPAEARAAVVRRRDELRGSSLAALDAARDLLVSGQVSRDDPDFRGILLAPGTMVFARAAATPAPEQAAHYREALELYDRVGRVFPDDPRPVFYRGLCYERLFVLAQPAEKAALFEQAESAYRRSLTLTVSAPEYHPLLPERALASLYNSAGRYQEALDYLKRVQRTDPAYSRSSGVDRDVQTLETHLARTTRP